MKNKGFISWIILAIVALALLKYFLNWDVFDAAASPEGKSTIDYVRNVINAIWSVVGRPLVFVWEGIFWPILSFAWESFQDLIVRGKELDLKSVSIPNF